MIGAVLTRDPEPPRHAGPLAPDIAGLMRRDPAQRLDVAAARAQLLTIAGGYPTFEHPTTPIADPDIGSSSALRANAVLLVALNAAVGALLALLVYSLSDGMPILIAAALVIVIAAGAGLGAWLAPRLERWIGLPSALSGGALLMGESFVGAGLLVDPRRPIATTVLSGIAMVSFAVWLRLSRVLRQRLLPAEQLGHASRVHRARGFSALVPAHSSRRTIGAGGQGQAMGPFVTTSVALVLPVVVGVQAGTHYVEGRHDFTSLPNVCSSSSLSQDEVAQYIEDPPELQAFSGTSSVDCTWKRIGEDRAQLEVYVKMYDNAREAERGMSERRRSAENDGETITEFQSGDDAFRYPFDGYLSSEDTLGVGVEIRIDNVVIEVELEQADSKGSPDAYAVQTLATDLSQELERQKPHR